MIKEFCKKPSGFTLVELLVVIAIIGLLSTIVLVSFGPIRNSAKDVTIKANISQMRLAMELQYSEKGNYGGGNTRPDFNAANEAAKAAGATMVVKVDSTTNASYCAAGSLQSETGSWCVDDTGFVGKGTCAATNNCTP